MILVHTLPFQGYEEQEVTCLLSGFLTNESRPKLTSIAMELLFWKWSLERAIFYDSEGNQLSKPPKSPRFTFSHSPTFSQKNGEIKM